MICSVQLTLHCSLLPVYARFGTMSLYHHIQKLAVALCFPSPFNHIATEDDSSITNLKRPELAFHNFDIFLFLHRNINILVVEYSEKAHNS